MSKSALPDQGSASVSGYLDQAQAAHHVGAAISVLARVHLDDRIRELGVVLPAVQLLVRRRRQQILQADGDVLGEREVRIRLLLLALLLIALALGLGLAGLAVGGRFRRGRVRHDCG